MEIYVNDERLDFTLEKEETLGDVVKAVDAWLAGSGFAMTSILTPGHELNAEAPESWLSLPIGEVEALRIAPLGVEDIALFEGCFDVVFLMGILYHRSAPVDCLRKIRKAMRPGGCLLIESQGIPGEEPVALFPEKTYAKVPGTYFVPTPLCLLNWVRRAGYSESNIFCTHPMTNLEQHRTDWMDFESFEDFIDDKDASKTVEGYPAPIRIFVKAIY